MKSVITIILVLYSIVYSQPTNYKVSGTGSDHNEVSIAINPTDPNNLIGGANIKYVYTSTNGGINWTQNNMTSTYGVWGDPCIVFDVNGNAYYAHLSNATGVPGGYWIDRIVVQKSTNKGVSWSPGVGVFFNSPKEQDKEWMIVDWTNSPYRNNLYVSWTEFDNYGSSASSDSSRILFSRSTDGGQTFPVTVRLSEKGGNCIDEDLTVEGAVPAVGPNGEVYVAWAGPLGLVFDRSLDGGVTWGNDIVVTSIPGGWDFAIPGIQRCNGLPITCADISNSPYRGNVYINWSDQRNGTTNTDVWIVKSTNSGLTWSQPKRVNQDNSNRHQFFCWMSVDPGTGYIYVSYYDRRNYTDNKTDYYLSRSTDGGETFTDIKLSQSSFLPSSSVFFGDYSCVNAFNGKVHAIWNRMDGTTMSTWTAMFQDTVALTTTSSFSLNSGWNLLSMPLRSPDMSVSALFPGKISNVYGYDGSYYVSDTVKNGNGYWVKFENEQGYNQSGTLIQNLQIPLNEGWNLIGTLNGNIGTNTITTNPAGIINSSFYEFSNGYQTATTLTQGKGYWVKASQSGTMNLSISQFKTAPNVTEVKYGDFDRLVISDEKSTAFLYISSKIVDKNLYEMPPLPPAGIFDVRFANGRSLISAGESSEIKLSGIKGKLNIRLESRNKYRLLLKAEKEYELNSDSEILIDENNLNKILVQFNTQIQEQFLSQNYPNPFNGNTKINFFIPKDNGMKKVSLNLFNVLGQKVIQLFEKETEGGYYSVDFNVAGRELPSGIYFYELLVKSDENIPVYKAIKKLNYIK